MTAVNAVLYRFGWECLDWVFPPECGGCGKHGCRWCEDCAQKVLPIKEPICQRCGQSLSISAHSALPICYPCQKETPSYSALRSWAVFEGVVRNGLHSLKYGRNLGLGDVFSQALGEVLQRMKWNVDLIVPVPLSEKRLQERGYNQAEYLARPLAWDHGLAYCPPAVRRKKETVSQVGLNLEERRKNMHGAFQAEGRFVGGKTILLVDDVATTGATLNACSRALLDEGARLVYGLTLARAQYIT